MRPARLLAHLTDVMGGEQTLNLSYELLRIKMEHAFNVRDDPDIEPSPSI
jgi:hypothetical protein